MTYTSECANVKGPERSHDAHQNILWQIQEVKALLRVEDSRPRLFGTVKMYEGDNGRLTCGARTCQEYVAPTQCHLAAL